ncbi:MAG: hypothetical protein AAF253_15555, partial [Pseudomonadota bacterium]
WLAGDAWINSVTHEEIRVRVITGYVACLFAGFSQGPLALDAVGIEGIAPFLPDVVALALAVLPLVAVLRLVPPLVPRACTHRERLQTRSSPGPKQGN